MFCFSLDSVCVYFPCRNIHVYLSLTVTSVQVCTASSAVRETAADSHRSPSAAKPRISAPLFIHLWTSLARLTLGGAIPATPITSEKTDVNLILPVRVSRRHRSSPPTQRSLSDSCPDFEWHQSQSSVTLMLSRSWLRWTDGGWPIYTPVTWSPTALQARNIKLTAAYSEMCDCPGACRYSGLSAFYF